MIEIVLIVFWLIIFEVICSIDNAVINAQVLWTMKNEKAKNFFLTWWMFFAIFFVRWVLPFLIVFIANSSLWLFWTFDAIWNSDSAATKSIEHSIPLLMLWWWIFLLLLFLDWFFCEEKKIWFKIESLALKIWKTWFYAISTVLLLIMIILINKYSNHESSQTLIIATTIWFSVFFISNWFKQNAQSVEKDLLSKKSWLNDRSKVLYLELLDITFSIDWVIWAFAFTSSIPLILIWNWIWAVVVRQLTISNIENIKKFWYIKNWAMYSIFILSIIMILEWFWIEVPTVVSPIATISCLWFFLLKSLK